MLWQSLSQYNKFNTAVKNTIATVAVCVVKACLTVGLVQQNFLNLFQINQLPPEWKWSN